MLEALRSRERGRRKKREDPRQERKEGGIQCSHRSLARLLTSFKGLIQSYFLCRLRLVVTVTWECVQTHPHEKEGERCKADQRSDQGSVM